LRWTTRLTILRFEKWRWSQSRSKLLYSASQKDNSSLFPFRSSPNDINYLLPVLLACVVKRFYNAKLTVRIVKIPLSKSALIKRRIHCIIRSIDAFMTPRCCLWNDVYAQVCMCAPASSSVCLPWWYNCMYSTAREVLFVPGTRVAWLVGWRRA